MAAHHCTDKSTIGGRWQLLIMEATRLDPVSTFSQRTCLVINQNLYTSLGIVNGKKATAVDFALDESAKIFSFGDNTVGEYFQTMAL